MTSERETSKLVEQTGYAILRCLRQRPEGASKTELARTCDVSEVTTQRALNWLRDQQDAPIDWDSDTRSWRLLDPQFALPLGDPTREDLTAVLFAGALLSPLADDKLNVRLQRLIEDMDAHLRSSRRERIRQGAIMASATTASPIAPELMSTLTRAVGRHVVRIDYHSPWQDTQRFYDIEPWQLRVHDGALYLRAHSRTTRGPRNFKVAQIDSARILEGFEPSAPMPPPEKIWGEGDPAYGIDEDRPGIAVLRMRGGVARWVARIQWHPEQQDSWLEPGELLERRVPYRSCREFARRLLSLGQGLDSVEPKALRGEIRAHARALLQNLGDADV